MKHVGTLLHSNWKVRKLGREFVMNFYDSDPPDLDATDLMGSQHDALNFSSRASFVSRSKMITRSVKVGDKLRTIVVTIERDGWKSSGFSFSSSGELLVDVTEDIPVFEGDLYVAGYIRKMRSSTFVFSDQAVGASAALPKYYPVSIREMTSMSKSKISGGKVSGLFTLSKLGRYVSLVSIGDRKWNPI